MNYSWLCTALSALPYIFYGDSTDPDPQLYQVILSCKSAIVKFCKTFEELYGFQMCTPNMHMACHFKDCILDYGPISAFWCFSFERYNGTMEECLYRGRAQKSKCFQSFSTYSSYLHTLETCVSDSEFFNIVCKQTKELQATKVHASVEYLWKEQPLLTKHFIIPVQLQ